MRDQVRTADGRALTVERWGDPGGRPVFLLHGTPGSRLGPAPRGMVLYQRRMQLIAYDRPGYGGSDRHPGRTVADTARDVAAVADALGLDTFAVAGRSGGAPGALACAALLPDRVTRTAALVGLAPWDAEDLDWFAGMADSNVREYSTAFDDPEGLAARLIPRAAGIRRDPGRLLDELRRELTASDRAIVADAGLRSMLLRNYQEGLRTSAYGWIDDALAFSRPWGFDPADIRCPVLIWHGELDVFSPVGHSRWLARRIPGATAAIDPAAAHFAALRALPDVLNWLLREAPAPPASEQQPA
ncbi:alpha/beta fold hydrolase [Streptomyces subrutilus]|uniref:Alpha/beta hydrolase n=1 Tax=Streptomyces subrutilus TaxID=36818 RepID=A0A5P2UWY7_9ACTN|nr:alpha/beta hydrolase [Streptomyces subrutilus]QEU81267.1 alpha/beta hydrolase [Streptomyces subrutilus]WSJ29408.1 alpha/beta hydrolase [Streptomyces subrutilus]GGZ85844.1 alpha/beta hydrolase [Streptomyces subrutilus]